MGGGFQYTLLCGLPCVCLYKNSCMCILAEPCGCAQTTFCVNSSLAVGWGHTPVCACVCVLLSACVSMYVLIDGVTAGCQAYLPPPPLSPPLLFLPPTALFHPRLIWQRRRRRAGARVTKGHCSSSNIALMPLSPLSRHLVSLLCPHFSLLPAVLSPF